MDVWECLRVFKEGWSIYKEKIFVCAETAMGKNIHAQSNSDSEYVKSVYKWVNLQLCSHHKTPNNDEATPYQ